MTGPNSPWYEPDPGMELWINEQLAKALPPAGSTPGAPLVVGADGHSVAVGGAGAGGYNGGEVA